MLGTARTKLLTRALAALLTVVVCGGALEWGHRGDDDAACNAAFIVHDHAAHRFGTGSAERTQPPDHCYICHTLRLLHAALTAQAGRIDAPRPRVGYLAGCQVAVPTVRTTTRASRAPPSAAV
jgi:hypothetical protein